MHTICSIADRALGVFIITDERICTLGNIYCTPRKFGTCIISRTTIPISDPVKGIVNSD